MSFQQAMEHVARFFEAIGALVLVAGLVVSVGLALRSWRHDRSGQRAWQVLRNSFGNVILLGLEILVAADLVRTVAVAPTVENVVILGVIVLIRTLLSFSLEIEIEGVAPWRRALTTGTRRRGGTPVPAATSIGPGLLRRTRPRRVRRRAGEGGDRDPSTGVRAAGPEGGGRPGRARRTRSPA